MSIENIDLKNYAADDLKKVIEDVENTIELVEVKLSAALKMFSQVKGDDVSEMAKELVEGTIRQIEGSISYENLIFLLRTKNSLNSINNNSNFFRPLEIHDDCDFIQLTKLFQRASFTNLVNLPWPSKFNDKSSVNYRFKTGIFKDLNDSSEMEINYSDMALMRPEPIDLYKDKDNVFGSIKYLNNETSNLLNIILNNNDLSKAFSSFVLTQFLSLMKEENQIEYKYEIDPEDSSRNKDFTNLFKQFELSCYAYNAFEEAIREAKEIQKNKIPTKVSVENSLWGEYLEGIKKLIKSINRFSNRENKQLFESFTGDVLVILYNSIYDFLVDNNMNPLGIPTIRELGEKPGGFALVKKISNVGGLRKIRDEYISWAADHIRKSSPLSKKKEFLAMKGRQRCPSCGDIHVKVLEKIGRTMRLECRSCNFRFTNNRL